MLLDGPVGNDVVNLLTERAGGNPSFVEQILFYLQEDRGLYQKEGRWHLSRNGKTASLLPDDVRAIFVARLDRLASEVRQVVQTASVLGRDFEIQILAAMLRGDDQLMQKVAIARNEAVWSTLTEIRYIFRHALMRDAAYEVQLRAHRRTLHRLTAETLTELYKDNLLPYYADIAYHYERAYLLGGTDLREEAITALQRAGKHVAANYENETAVDYFNRALRLATAEDGDVYYNLLLAREAIFHTLGNREAQGRDLEMLVGIVQSQPAKQIEVALRQARYAHAMSDYATAIKTAVQATQLAASNGDTQQEAMGHIAWANALWQQGDYNDSNNHIQQAIELAQAGRHHALVVEALSLSGIIDREQGNLAGSRRYFGKALILARKIGDHVGRAKLLNNLGMNAHGRGDYMEASDYYRQALEAARELGIRFGESIILNNLGVIARDLGQYDQADTYYKQALTIAREIGNKTGEANLLNDLGMVAQNQGDLRQAKAYQEQALTIVHEIGNRPKEGFILTCLGDVLAELGQPEQAIHMAQKAVALRRDLGNPALLVESLANLARIYLLQERQDAAVEVTQEIMAYLANDGNLDDTVAPLRIPLICYQVLQAANDPQALPLLETTYQQLQTQANKIPDDAIRHTFLQNIPWHRDILEAWQVA